MSTNEEAPAVARGRLHRKTCSAARGQVLRTHLLTGGVRFVPEQFQCEFGRLKAVTFAEPGSYTTREFTVELRSQRLAGCLPREPDIDQDSVVGDFAGVCQSELVDDDVLGVQVQQLRIGVVENLRYELRKVAPERLHEMLVLVVGVPVFGWEIGGCRNDIDGDEEGHSLNLLR